MSVRVNGEHVHVQRQSKIIPDGEVAGSGRDIELTVAFKLDQQWKPVRRLVGEVQANGRFHFHGHTHCHDVRVQYQIRAGIEFPGEAVWLDPWRTSGLPEKKVAVEIENAVLNTEIHAGETCAGLVFTT